MIAFPVVFLWNAARSVHHLNIDLRAVVRSLAGPVLAATLMYAVVSALRPLLQLRPPAALVALAAAGAAAYFAGTMIFNRRGLDEVRGLLQSR